jgi:hypothetical protein
MIPGHTLTSPPVSMAAAKPTPFPTIGRQALQPAPISQGILSQPMQARPSLANGLAGILGLFG